jgi:1-deoxy-D-xylulose-5-phosphate reductoisomerase
VKNIIILGSTGSIGTQTLDVVERHADRFRVVGLTADKSWELLAEQAERFVPQAVALRDADGAAKVRERLGRQPATARIEVLSGEEGIRKVAVLAAGDVAVVALVGVSGLLPTLDAIEAGKDIALANKETLVVGGELVSAAVRRKGVSMLPIDSEHSALFQCLVGEERAKVSRLILTCSGGPFRQWEESRIPAATVRDALKHPTWNMGAKITIDSATLMNKGFEVIEAHYLYDMPYEKIDVVVHPESVIHSFVEYVDGSVLSQLGPPDMRLPIQYALSYPERLGPHWKQMDFAQKMSLTFERPRREVFPCLGFGYEAGQKGGTMPCALNAANEIAVALFLAEKIAFGDIARIIARTMAEHPYKTHPTLDDLIACDAWCREHAAQGAMQPQQIEVV